MNVVKTYARAIVATSNTTFDFGTGISAIADGVYIAATITTSGLVLTKPDGTTVDVGLAVIGTVIPISCTKAVFSGGPAGAVIAMQTNK